MKILIQNTRIATIVSLSIVILAWMTSAAYAHQFHGYNVQDDNAPFDIQYGHGIYSLYPCARDGWRKTGERVASEWGADVRNF